jgi:hypothetical protein
MSAPGRLVESSRFRRPPAATWIGIGSSDSRNAMSWPQSLGATALERPKPLEPLTILGVWSSMMARQVDRVATHPHTENHAVACDLGQGLPGRSEYRDVACLEVGHGRSDSDAARSTRSSGEDNMHFTCQQGCIWDPHAVQADVLGVNYAVNDVTDARAAGTRMPRRRTPTAGLGGVRPSVMVPVERPPNHLPLVKLAARTSCRHRRSYASS